jgi:hypothetical protein
MDMFGESPIFCTMMTSRPVKLLACALGLAVVLASSAAAAKIKKSRPARPQVTAGNSPRCRGANLIHCGPVYNANDYLGDDPDPFIRLMIQRDLGAKYGGES